MVHNSTQYIYEICLQMFCLFTVKRTLVGVRFSKGFKYWLEFPLTFFFFPEWKFALLFFLPEVDGVHQGALRPCRKVHKRRYKIT